MVLAFFVVSFLFIFVDSSQYPPCWIKNGECLDNNEPALREWQKPQINHNIIGDSIENVDSVTKCSEECFDNPECR